LLIGVRLRCYVSFAAVCQKGFERGQAGLPAHKRRWIDSWQGTGNASAEL